MRIVTLAIVAALAGAVLPTRAQDQVQPQTPSKSQDRIADQPPPVTNAPPKTPTHFSFNRVDGGFLRLDNETGQIAFCSMHGPGWACEAVPEDRAALEKEIARLQDEVAKLKTEVASLRAPPPPVPPQTVPPEPQTGKRDEPPIKLPTAEDMARARAFFELVWRRLEEMIGNIQKDMMRKG